MTLSQKKKGMSLVTTEYFYPIAIRHQQTFQLFYCVAGVW